MEFLEKIEKNPYEDLYWNVPEREQGRMTVIGGNAQSFRTPVKVAEFLTANFPLEEVRVVLPDALQGKLPPLPNLTFLKSTESGSFARAEELKKVTESVDFSLVTGDLSKNSITEQAVRSALRFSDNRGGTAKPVLITRDTVDLIAGEEALLMQPELIIMGSIAQWQKIFKAVYYPKTLMMSQSLVQVAEAFHKFTLSYPVRMVSLHEGQILVAADGKVVAVPLSASSYSPLTIWGGELAAKIATMNLYNPGKFIEATVVGIFESKK